MSTATRPTPWFSPLLSAAPSPPPSRLPLQRGEASRLPGQPTRLCSAAGTLWITVDHDPRDIVLEARQCITLHTHEPMTVSALQGPAVLDWHPVRP